jgi:nitrogen fixation/metabolism regulation signal transduction histidine kinase
MDGIEAEQTTSAWSWWEGPRRLIYNAILVGALGLGAVLFLFGLFVWMGVETTATVASSKEPPEFTIFTAAFMAFASMVGLFLANLLYFLGPLGEMVLPRSTRRPFRRLAYPAGVLFSLTMILGLPSIMVVHAISKLALG